jgi:CBS domain containing-hemolysin-like protein
MGQLLQRWLSGDGESEHPAAPSADEAEVDIVDQAEAFQTLRVGDVMTPRVDIVALEISSPLAEVVGRFVEAEHSRIPLYRETLDDPVGVVHVKDVLRLIAPQADEPDAKSPPWREPVLHRLKREVLYVPASMRCADLLLRMRVARIHMALVIDEFGGTDGLVTLEDLIEAVVGEIADEHDEQATPSLVSRPGGLLEADARVPLDELEALLGESLSPGEIEEEIDTVAGLVSTLAGRVPQRGEVIVHPAGVEFEVIDADPRRIRRLRIRRLEAAVDGLETAAADTPEAAEPRDRPSVAEIARPLSFLPGDGST